MQFTHTSAEINNFFINDDPVVVWKKALEIVLCISPEYNPRIAQTIFDDVIALFGGNYPGYCPVKTPYHDLRHTLDVFLCAVRLMHGMQLSGTPLSDDDVTMVMIAALMHDIGYAQRLEEEHGTGAQFTRCHVDRSNAFMLQYFTEKNLPSSWVAPLKQIILCSNPALNMSEIEFPNEQARLLGQILGTADMTGQMADRTYLEKLLFLYLEFEEAHFGNYQNIHDLLRNTQMFYESARIRLRDQFGDINVNLSHYFKYWYGIENNYYIESIEKNIAYLTKVTAVNDANHLAMLKRGGIVQKVDPLLGH